MKTIRLALSCLMMLALLMVPPFSARAHDDKLHDHDQPAFSEILPDPLRDHGHSHDDPDDPAMHKQRHAHHAADHTHDAGILTFFRAIERRRISEALPRPADESAPRAPGWPLERPPRAA